MKDVTIDDVAEHAGVSKSTVSAVLNDRDVVRATTRQRILDAIETLDYRPRGSARRGFTAPSGKSIGFVIKEADNPYYSETLVGIQDAAHEKGFLTYVSSSEGRLETEQKIIKQFADKDLDGLIITPILNDDTDLSHLFELKRNNIPFVLLEDIRGLQADLVDIDNTEASATAVQHLIELGHEHIVHFAGPAYSEHTQERIEGVHHAFSRSPLVLNDESIVPTGDSFEKGYEQSLDFFSDWDGDVTGVTCYNDLVALGAMKGLRELGISVPGDLSIIGFDDLKLLDYFPIPLTTVRVPKYEMGRRATDLLLDQIDSGTNGSPEQIVLDAELVVRSSTAPPPDEQ